jgi:lipid-binding SYLF domain-containing protein
VFPDVLKGGFIVGAEYGRGALFIDGKTQGYYSSAGGSIGFQAGAQSKAVVVLFMTEEALRQFLHSEGWTIGADATVAVADIGANGSIDSNTVRQPVVGFVMNNVGLMAGISLDGAKINRLNLQ